MASGSSQASGVNNEDIDGSETEIEDFSDIVENKVKKSRLWSSAWDYFDIVDPKRKLAECRRCNLTFTYRSSVGNLMKHMRRRHLTRENTDIEDSNHKASIEKHEMNIEQLEDLTDNEGIFNFKTVDTKPGRSVVWSYFTIVDKESGLVRCLLCSKQLSYSGCISNLRKHMKAKHPLAPLNSDKNTMIVSSGDQLYELETASKDETENIDDNEQSHLMDATYLEEFDPIGDENVSFAPNSNKKKRNPKKRTMTRVVVNDISDDEVVLKKRYEKKTCDSLDYFGKYVVSLLRKLPQKTSDKMQMDIVKRLMEAQTACGAGEANVTSKSEKVITMSGTIVSEMNEGKDNTVLSHN